MTNKKAIKILQDELKHTEFHLKDKNKADEFYEELKLYCEALRLAIKVLEPKQGKFECRIKIKDLISMLLEFDMNEKATICTIDEYNENNIVISITDTRGKEDEL